MVVCCICMYLFTYYNQLHFLRIYHIANPIGHNDSDHPQLTDEESWVEREVLALGQVLGKCLSWDSM